jgi:single-strand DNA-binding protein
MDLNKAMVIGRLTRDPDQRTTQSGQSISSFSVATNLNYTDSTGQKQNKVQYHNIIAWRKLADICNQYLRKGSKIYVEGRLETRSWQDPNGVTKNKTEIIAENMIMLDSKNMTPGGAPNNFSAPAMSSNDQMNEPIVQPEPEEEEIKIEDIPF